MKTMTIEQLQENYNKLIQFIETTFSGERKEKLLKMYDDLAERIIDAPASGREHYHYAMPGGYILHVLHVIKLAEQIHNLWKENGAYCDNYTLEELLFAALHHDLGKIGDDKHPYYIPNESDWHRKNQGMIYDFCKDIEYMVVPQRSIYLLQKYGIEMTSTEMLGILLTDGLYDEANKVYLISYRPENKPKTNVPYILHQADFMASNIENNQWKYQTGPFAIEDDELPNILTPTKSKKSTNKTTKKQEDLAKTFENTSNVDVKKLFDDLFSNNKED